MTNTDPPDEEPTQRDKRGVSLDRRSYLGLVGTTVATLSPTAAEAGSDRETLTAGGGPAVGYGGLPKISRLPVPDPFESSSQHGGPDAEVTQIEPDGQARAFDVGGGYDLFEVVPAVGSALTITFDGANAIGAAILGLFDSTGTVLEQVYIDTDNSVYIPDAVTSAETHYMQVAGLAGSAGQYALSVATNQTTSSQSPYEGTARSLPGRIQAEHFDVGGEGVAYHDTSEGSEYDLSYRDGSVDIRETKDTSGDYNIGYFEDDEWLEYTVDPTPGTYDLHVRVASARSGRQLAVTLDGESLGTVDIPNTGGWSNWETVTIENVTINTDGSQVLRFEASQSGIDFNWFEFEAVELKGPYGGSARSVPGQIQAEHFDTGGEGIAYHDTTEGNEYDTSYRDASVDIRKTKDERGEYNIGYFEDGEWLEYTVAPDAGTYDLHVRLASARSGRQLAVTLDGEPLTTVAVPNTGGWSNWETVTIEAIDIGTDTESTLRFEAVGSGIDFNWFEFERVTVQGPFEGTVATLPGRIQAEHFDTGGEGVAYHDTTEGNEYGLAYRDMSVDIRETADESGAYNVGYFEDGEWLEYTVSPTPDTYDINVRVATARSDRQLAVTLNGDSLGTIDIPNTGDWSNWETVTLSDVEVTADTESVLRLEAIGSGIDINWVEFETATQESTPEPTQEPTPEPTQLPYGDSAATVPGRVEAENFDLGGQDEAYHDTTEGNEYDTSYRDTSVDIRETADESGAYNVGYFEDGEWLEYTVDVTPGTYDLWVRLASARSDRQLTVTLDGEQLGTVDVPNTGGWSNWDTVRLRDVTLPDAGIHVLRFQAAGSGIDFNWFEIVESTDSDYGELGYGESEYGGATN